MSNYEDDYDARGRGYHNGPAPPPYPSSGAHFDGYNNASMPQQSYGTDVPPPPLGDQYNRRASAMKRSGSQSRVPHLQPQFPDEASYLGSTAPDLENKNRRRHREFRDKRDGYESDEGEAHRKTAPRGDKRGGHRGDSYDDRGPPRRHTYDDEEPRRRRDKNRDRDRDRDYDDPPSRHRKRDPPGVEYGSDPVPAVKRNGNDRRSRRDRDYDDDDDYDDYDDDRRRGSRRRSVDETRRRRRDYDDEDDRSDRRSKRDDRDRDRDRSRDDRRRDRSRRRYSDDESEYDDRRDRDRRRRRSSAPPKEIKIGDYDIGPWIEKGKKHYGAVAPILTPIIMNYAKKRLGGRR